MDKTTYYRVTVRGRVTERLASAFDGHERRAGHWNHVARRHPGARALRGPSLLETWIFRILTNRAKTRAVRESKTIPLSALVGAEDGDEGPSVDPERFLPASHSRWPRHWASPPRSWAEIPEAQLLSKETRALIESAIEALPPIQAQVIALRDVEGWTAEDVCALLDLSAANQRVLLHRARSKVRAALEQYLD